MPCALSYPTCLVFCVLSCPTCSRVPCASYHTCSRVSRASCPIRYCASRALCPMWPRALHFMSPFSLSTVLSCTLHILWPNITFCVLEFPSFMLLFFCLFVTCYFRGELTKFTTNIVGLQYFKITISIYQQYDKFEFFET